MHLPTCRNDVNEGYRSVRLIATISVVQLALHLYTAFESRDPRLFLPHLVAWSHGLLILSILVFASSRAIALFPSRFRNRAELVTLTIIALALLPLSLYPQMLREYLSFPVNLFAATPASASSMLTKYLGLSRLMPIAFAATSVLAALLMPPFPAWSKKGKFFLPVLWGMLLTVAILTLPRSPHPVVNSLKEEISALLSHERREVPALFPAPQRQDAMNPSGSGVVSLQEQLKAEHIYLIVLEGVSANQFEKAISGNDSVFYRRVARHARYFDRYYTTNLDSYTSLIAMLTSEQVPYRSYTDTGLYDAVNNAPNLARSFKDIGFHTLFISTYDDQPFIPVRRDWSNIMHRQDLPAGKQWVSVESSRMESATEDRAALSTLGKLSSRYAKTFVLHELAYGHTTEWRAKTGIQQLAYYDTYLNELLDLLIANGTWSKSLMVIVSDHGDRAKGADTESYRVPLMIVGKDMEAGIDHTFRSHLDLQQIIASSLTGKTMPKQRKEAILVGSTERWIYGLIDAHGNHLVIDDRTGRVIASNGQLSSQAVNSRFQEIINNFGKRFGMKGSG